jgi:hypothetical protein
MIQTVVLVTANICSGMKQTLVIEPLPNLQPVIDKEIVLANVAAVGPRSALLVVIRPPPELAYDSFIFGPFPTSKLSKFIIRETTGCLYLSSHSKVHHLL